MHGTCWAVLCAALLLAAGVSAAPRSCATNAISSAVMKNGFCAFNWKSGLSNPRALDVAPNGDLIIVESGAGRITALWENANGDVQTATLYSNSGSGINHGIKIHDGFLYASSDTRVYRWAYTSSNYRQALGTPTTVVQNMPPGGHSTRTIAFDSQGRMYISIGSLGNIDSDSRRSRVVRISLAGKTLPVSYPTGFEVFADGLRNEVGLRFDPAGRLWGVENGLDNLGVDSSTRQDFGAIYVTNPAEEVNLMREEDMNKHYGYPWCWSEGRGEGGNALAFSQGSGPGTQWATRLTDSLHTDAWCKNASNVVAPRYSLQAHTAPLDILFYTGTTFPNMQGKVAFVAKHGSWNRPSNNPSGRSVSILWLDANGFPVTEEAIFSGPVGWIHRPVGLAVASCGAYGECLYVSDDAGGNIIAIAAGLASSTPVAPPPPPPPPVGFNDPRTINLLPGLSFSYVLNSDNTITMSLSRNDVSGWLALGINTNPGMIGSKAVLASASPSQQIGRISVDSFDEAAILGTWNQNTAVPWTITNPSYTTSGNRALLNFTRTMSGIDITKPFVIITAWHIAQPFDIATSSLPKHSGAASFRLWLNNGTVVAPYSTDNVTPFGSFAADQLRLSPALVLLAAITILFLQFYV